MPLGQRHADRHLELPILLGKLVTLEEARGEVRGRGGLGGVGNEGGGLDDAVAGVEVVRGRRREGESAVVDARSCEGS